MNQTTAQAKEVEREINLLNNVVKDLLDSLSTLDVRLSPVRSSRLEKVGCDTPAVDVLISAPLARAIFEVTERVNFARRQVNNYIETLEI